MIHRLSKLVPNKATKSKDDRFLWVCRCLADGVASSRLEAEEAHAAHVSDEIKSKAARR